jgi:hypothetical protein
MTAMTLNMIPMRFVFLAMLTISLTTAQSVQDQLHEVTTLIQVTGSFGASSQASGFFYNHFGPADPNISGPQWRQMQETWLVTNRHVVLPRLSINLGGSVVDKEFLPDSLIFNLRSTTGDALKWEPIVLTQPELLKRTKCDPNPIVDVCAIKIEDLLAQRLKAGSESGLQYLPWGGISNELFPGGGNKLQVEAGDAILVADIHEDSMMRPISFQ